MKFIATDVDDSVTKLADKLGAAALRPDHAIDAYFYRSHLVYERELRELIFRSWIYAGHVSELVNPGDYLLLDIGEDSLIIVRDNDGEIRALMNVCRHRGARVCEEAAGNRKTFVCPYHGWVYNTDGSLKAAREMGMRADFDQASHGLKQAKVVVYMGLVFINCDRMRQISWARCSILMSHWVPTTSPMPRWRTSRLIAWMQTGSWCWRTTWNAITARRLTGLTRRCTP